MNRLAEQLLEQEPNPNVYSDDIINWLASRGKPKKKALKVAHKEVPSWGVKRTGQRGSYNLDKYDEEPDP